MRRSLRNTVQDLLRGDQLWAVMGMAIAVGMILGLLFVLAIVIRRRKQTFNSLIRLEDCIGLSAAVEVPFDELTSGKVRIQLDNQTLACVAYTSQPHQFNLGDSVVVVGIKGQKVWVIPAQEFHNGAI